jgi:hypothetical protein
LPSAVGALGHTPAWVAATARATTVLEAEEGGHGSGLSGLEA